FGFALRRRARHPDHREQDDGGKQADAEHPAHDVGARAAARLVRLDMNFVPLTFHGRHSRSYLPKLRLVAANVPAQPGYTWQMKSSNLPDSGSGSRPSKYRNSSPKP